MKRLTVTVGLIAGLLSGQVFAQNMSLTGDSISTATIQGLEFKMADFTSSSDKQGRVESMSQGMFKFDRGYDDGYVGPAGYFQSNGIISCSNPIVKITSLADFTQLPTGDNPFPVFGLSSYDKKAPSTDDGKISRVGFRLYNDDTVMNFSALENIDKVSHEQVLASIKDRFGAPSFVLKDKNGWRVIYLDKAIDAAPIQLAYENALNPEKPNNLLNMTPSTVLYGVLMDASLNSDLNLNISGSALEFYIGDEYWVFTKYFDLGKFIGRVNTALEHCETAPK
ncbi:hypothetical protein DZ860_11935 [Vibrio sinensis]|uniref:Uncharacterized protein n=1 Tax=Vibrio sinensis TaxID=2302434 RepID=A0A3A6R4E2_9VIBR|nr:hypothetical protein [Vibrio sinensis]RJX71033.1 hypothetical protein DZ860_11935 [Vibrio sinensis]